MKSTKRPREKEELLNIWANKGLEIINSEFILKAIQRLNYYRLSGYAKYFYNEDRKFIIGTTFEDIYNLYLFDGELRRIIMSLTEEIELNFRSYIASYIGNTYGAYSYLDGKYFEKSINPKTNKSFYEEFIGVILKKKENSKNKSYIKHYIEKYDGQIPIWVIVEILSFSDISKFIKNMKNEDRKALLEINYDLSKDRINALYLPNSIKIICDVRNMCAHYEKIFDLNLINAPRLNKHNTIPNNSLYDVLFICRKIINDEVKWNNAIRDIELIIDKYNFKKLELLGFEENIWKESLVKK